MIEFLTSQYVIHLLILIGLYLLLSLSLNIPFGYGKLFHLAHISIFGIGAYSTALLTTRYEWSFPPTVIVGMLLGAAMALILSAIAVRLKEDYFAICTLAVSSVVHAFMVNWKDLTGGVLGVPGIPRPIIFGTEFSDNSDFLLLVLCLVVVSLIGFVIFERSSMCRALKAQAEFEFSAQAVAISPTAVRSRALIISALFAALSGSLFASYLNYIDPSSFTLTELIFLLSIIIVGGPGNLFGVLAATIGLVLLPELLRFVITQPGVLGPLRQLVAALVMFLFVYLRRKTLFPQLRKL